MASGPEEGGILSCMQLGLSLHSPRLYWLFIVPWCGHAEWVEGSAFTDDMIRSSWENQSPASKVHADSGILTILRLAARTIQKPQVRMLQAAGAARRRSFANLQGKLGTKGGLQDLSDEHSEAGIGCAALLIFQVYTVSQHRALRLCLFQRLPSL